ncbi:MAG: ABC transporter, partial [Methylophilaceae bacterium]|nr:ABC transporter [Methylophilaceae bacterium]
MKINNKLRLQLFMQNSFFVILFLILVALIGFLTREYHVSRDITQSNRNILTDGSINILKQMKGEVNITVFASEDNAAHGENYRKGVRDFISRYQRTKPDIRVTFVSPAEQPKQAQDAGIKAEGELVVEYQKRSEHLLPPYAEQEMTNLLVRLSR